MCAFVLRRIESERRGIGRKRKVVIYSLGNVYVTDGILLAFKEFGNPVGRRGGVIAADRNEQLDVVLLEKFEIEHSYYKYYIMVRPEMLKEGWNRDRIMTEISSTGLNCGVGACGELYQEIAFKKYFNTDKPERLPNAVELSNTTLMFQVHPTLTQPNIDDAIAIIREVLLEAGK